MLSSKQRAYLKSLASTMDTILIVGKGGISPEVIKQADDALAARELIKGKVLDTSPQNALEMAQEIAQETTSEVVQVIGAKFVLYRSRKKDPVIQLPRIKGKNEVK